MSPKLLPQLQSPELSIVIPFLNEAPCLEMVHSRLSQIIAKLKVSAEFVFIDDGSTDGGSDILKGLKKKDKRIRVFVLSRNFGKEAALSCGLDVARGQAVIPMDCDLQDPPELIEQMLKLWRGGADIVNAQRSNRDSDTWLKRTTSEAFYDIANRMLDTPLPKNVGDFRLIDRKVVEAIKHLPERRRFMKGLFAWVGFKTETIQYVRPERAGGKTKFNMWKLWNFALEGITSFSTVPLRIWMYFGLITALAAFAYGGFLFVRTIMYGVDIPGYASLFIAIVVFGGLNMFGMGLMGEYIGRIFIETKNRPIYLIRDEI